MYISEMPTTTAGAMILASGRPRSGEDRDERTSEPIEEWRLPGEEECQRAHGENGAEYRADQEKSLPEAAP